MLYVPMWRHQQRRVILHQINDWFIPILGCTLKPARIYSLQEKRKNMVMRFQSPLCIYYQRYQKYQKRHNTVEEHNLNGKRKTTEKISQCMRFPTMWYVRPAKPQISLCICAVWSEPLLVARISYECYATDWTPFEVSKPKRRLHRLVWVYTCQNATLLEIMYHDIIHIWTIYFYGQWQEWQRRTKTQILIIRVS